MSKRKDADEFRESVRSTIISYDVKIDTLEDELVTLRRERDVLRGRLTEEGK